MNYKLLDLALIEPYNYKPDKPYKLDTVSIYSRATIKGRVYPSYDHYSTHTEWGQYPTYKPCS